MRGELGKNGRKAKEGDKGKERDLRKMEGDAKGGEKPGAKDPGRTATKGRPLPTEGGGVKRPACLLLSCLSPGLTGAAHRCCPHLRRSPSVVNPS